MKYIVWLFFLCAVFPLYAQIREGAAVFVPPVSGIGSAPGDNAAFTNLLSSQMQEKNYTLTETPEAADWFLKGTLVPPGTSGEGGEKFLFSIDLQDKDGISLYSQDIYYLNMREANIHIPAALDRIFSPAYRDEAAERAAAERAAAERVAAEKTAAEKAAAERAAAGHISIYIPPVTGIGGAPGNNPVFTELLSRELNARGITLAQTPEAADWFLKGTLVPPGTSGEGGEKFLFSIDLQDKDGISLYSQDIYYINPEEVNSYMPETLNNMLSSLFNLQDSAATGREITEPVNDDAWRNKQWYFGAGLFWTPRLYYGTRLSTHLLNFGLGLSAEYHFPKYISAGIGLELAPDWVVASPGTSDHYRNTILQIPLSLGYVLKPGDKYMHTPYAGIVINIPFFPDTAPAPLSWQAGFQYGVKAGPGIFCADARFSMDFGASGLSANRPNDTRRYSRYIMYLGIGYKYGI